jgi:ADP-ribosyl-[dinitrogen reductase] hydrolase
MQSEVSPARHEASLYSALIGCVVGDALGIAYENLSPRRVLRLFPDPTRYHLLPSVGLVSDDAEQAIMTLRALACSGGAPARFQALSGDRVACMAGDAACGDWAVYCAGRCAALVGHAAPALAACVRRGMRLPCAGRFWASRLQMMPNNARRSCALRRESRILTRKQRRERTVLRRPCSVGCAERGRAAARTLIRQRIDACPAELRQPLHAALDKRRSRADDGAVRPVARLAARRVGLHRAYDGSCVARMASLSRRLSWGRWAVLVRCGGDTDSTAALLGIWMGAHLGRRVAPDTLIARLKDPLARPDALHALATATARAVQSATPQPVRRPLYPLRLGRNLLFLALVIAHLVRRALPPY